MAKEGKTAIVCLGGGMRSAYGAGFLYVLGKDLALKPDLVVGSSGDVPNLFYFLTGQYEFLRRAFYEILPTRRFVSVRRIRPIIDVDYLVDDVLKRQIPLDVEKLENSGTEYFVAVTESESGNVRYVTNTDHADIFELVRATSAIPFFFGKRVKLFGESYFDGGTGSTLQSDIDCAIDHGATRILLIDDSSGLASTRFEIFLFSLFTRRGLRKALERRYSDRRTYVVPRGVSVITVRPRDLDISATTESPLLIAAAFEKGASDALAMREEMRALFR